MILLRHGQSEFNLLFTASRVDPGIADPKLTELGHAQAAAAAERLAAEPIRRIVVSPYTRALQTAAPLAERLGVPVRITPLVRERYAFACDIGRRVSELARHWPDHDFSMVEEQWWPGAEEPAEQVVRRAGAFRAEMAERADWAETVVVSHWGFILAMTGISVENGAFVRCDPTAPPPAEIVWRHP